MRLDHLLSKEDMRVDHALSEKLIRVCCSILRVASKESTLKRENGGLAQLGEHLLCKQGVKGSIPLISTNREPRYLKEEDNRIRADSSGWLVFSGAENTFAQQM